MPRLPKPKAGRPAITQYNERIIALMEQGWGIDRIYDQLRKEGANIGRSALHVRMKEIREQDERGQLPPKEDQIHGLAVYA
jgi:hypothetical protein